MKTLFFIGLLSLSGCSRPAFTVSSGMKMSEAVQMAEARGLQSSTMAVVDDHRAFALPDDRALVLLGKDTVDRIEIVTDADKGKSLQKSKSVNSFSY